MEKLVNGMIIKDETLGLKWEVVDETTNKIKMVEGNTIVVLSKDKLKNFTLVSMPKENNEVKETNTIKYGLDNNGYIINEETGELITNQGELKFNYLSTLDIKNNRLFLVKSNGGYYNSSYDIYVYDILKDKFTLAQKDFKYCFSRYNSLYANQKYILFGFMSTGTYGDFRSAMLLLYDRNKGKFVCTQNVNVPIYGKFYVTKKTSSEVVLCSITSNSIGAFSKDTAFCTFITIKSGKISVEKRLLIGGSVNSKNIYFKNVGTKSFFFNGTHIALIDATTKTIPSVLELDTFSKNNLLNLKEIEKFSVGKTGNLSISFVNSMGENKTLKTKNTKDRGIVQSIV